VTGGNPLSVDPLLDAAAPGETAIASLTYRSLLRLGTTAKPVPDLASRLVESLDGLTYTLSIPAGLRWSDGSPLTPRDALATIQWVQSPGFPNATLASAWRGVSASVSGQNLVLTLGLPRASLAAALTALPILPLGSPQAPSLASLTARPATRLPTSGPYMVASSTATQVTLTANPYAVDRPRLPRVEVDAEPSFAAAAAAFAKGSIDAVVATTAAQRAQLLHRRGAVAHDLLTFGFVDLLFNEAEPSLADAAVRQAVADAVDREALIEGPVGGLGQAQVGPVADGIRWLAGSDAPPPPDLAAAQRGLDAAGWIQPQPGGVRSRDGVALRFDLQVADAAPLPAVAAGLAEELRAVGIQVTVSVVPGSSFLEAVLAPGDFQLALAAWDLGPDPDLSALWASTATPPHGYNVSHGSVDSFLDEDLAALATLSTAAQRQAAASRVAGDLARDLPAVFLYAPEESLVVSPRLPRVTTPPAGDPFADAASWS
jgi:peptide/nickel transport system substrate-binding protein